ALQPGKDGLVDGRRVLAPAEDRAGAGTAQRLVRGERHDVGIGNRRRVRSTRDQTGDVRGIDEQERIDFVRDRAKRLEVDDARIRGRARDDHARLLSYGKVSDLVVVEYFARVVDAVGDEVVHAAAEVHG